MNYLSRRVISCFLMFLILTLSLFSFVKLDTAKAVSKLKWKEVSITNPPFKQSYDGYYSRYCQTAELTETKSDGKKVRHLFQVNPAQYYSYAEGNYGGPLVLHSADDGSNWNKIIPAQWNQGVAPTNYKHGGFQIGLEVAKAPWTDGTGSTWNGRLFLYCNNDKQQPIRGRYMYRPSIYRYDGDGSMPNWITVTSDIPGYGTGTSYYPYNYYADGGYSYKAHIRYFKPSPSSSGKLYIIAYKYTRYSTYAYYRICLLRYKNDPFGSMSPNDPTLWEQLWQSPEYMISYSYYTPKVIYTFKTYEQASGSNYIFITTPSRTTSSIDYPYRQGNYSGSYIYRSSNGGSTFTEFGITSNSTTYLPGAPLCMEFYKNYLYAGFSYSGQSTHGKIYRIPINTFLSATNLQLISAGWQNCGVNYYINDSSLPSTYPTYPYTNTSCGIFAMGVFSGKLYFGGYYNYLDATNRIPGRTGYIYWMPLWSTEGVNSAGLDQVPLKFTLEEDEWRTPTKTYYNNTYHIFEIFPYSKGLMVSFYSSDTSVTQYRYRYFHKFYAPPSVSITHSPFPPRIELGTSLQINFMLVRVGAFGSGNVKVRLSLPENIFLKVIDDYGSEIPGSKPFREESPSGPFQSIYSPTIEATFAANIGTQNAVFIITDEVLDITVTYDFIIQVVPPMPGFTPTVSPSYEQVFRGDCTKFTVDITSRNDFANNVIIDIVWIIAPPSDDVTFEWERNVLISNYISDTSVDARVRKNITSRYFFTACTTDNTTLGTYKFRVTFMSGSIYKYVDVTFVVLRPPATFSITPVPATAKVVPGGSAYYRIKIESKNGYVGFVALSLQDMPLSTDITAFRAESPPMGYSNNYVELTLSQPFAFAILEVKTYPTYRDTEGNLIQGTSSGLHYIKVVGEGQGIDPEGNIVTPTAFGIAGLQVFQQIEDMKTPSFTFWGMILILIGIFGVVVSLLRKREKTIELK